MLVVETQGETAKDSRAKGQGARGTKEEEECFQHNEKLSVNYHFEQKVPATTHRWCVLTGYRAPGTLTCNIAGDPRNTPCGRDREQSHFTDELRLRHFYGHTVNTTLSTS